MSDKASTRSKSEIEADIAAARDRLASNIEGLITQAHPRAIFIRGVGEAKGFAAHEFHSAKQKFVADDGTVEVNRLAYLAAAVAGIVALVAVLRSMGRR